MTGNTVKRWTEVKLSELGKWVGGGTPSKSRPDFWEGGHIPWISPKDMKSIRIATSQDKITKDAVDSSSAKLVPEGSILVVTRSGILVHKLPLAVCEKPVTVNQDLKALILKDAFHRPYIFAALRSHSREILNDCRKSGTTVCSLNFQQLKDFKLPLPPLEEQRRIAEILDLADGLRAKRREALAEVEELTQAVFLEMFRPGDWPEIPLTESCKDKDDVKCGPFGTQLHRSEFTTSGVPLWGIKQVNAKFEIQTHEYISQKKAEELKSYSIKSGDIVMTRKGTVGNCAVYPESFETGVMHSDLLRIRVDRERYSPVFVSSQLHYSPKIDHQISLISGGAIMKGINVTKLKKISIESPPLELQEKFAERVKAIEKLKASHQRSLEEMDALFASLQSRAFKGEL